MIVAELFAQVNSAYRGADDNVPTTGTPDYTNWLAATNRKIAEWATDSKNDWASNFYYEKPNEPGTVATTATTTLTGTSTYFTDYNVGDTILVSGETVRTIDTITSNTVLTVTVAFSNTASGKTYTHDTIIKIGVQSYSVHRNFVVPSDKAYIVISSTNIPEFVIGKPQERDRYLNEVYFSGKNPRTVTFYNTIDASNNSNWIGGELKIPGYYAPNDVTGDDDDILIDDPFWLVYAVASELAFNDLTYEDKAPDLNAKANNLYQGMVNDNRRGTNNNPRIARTNVNRIPGVRNESTAWSE
jgi:hypothetical protein